MTTINFRIEFHTPFRVGTGGGDTQADQTLDDHNPLPASTIKGLMRQSARILLPPRPDPKDASRVHDHELVDAVFGGRPAAGGGAVDSPWHWEDGEVEAYKQRADSPKRQRVRIALKDGVVARHALVVGDELWASGASAEIWLRGTLAPADERLHVALLNWSATLMDGVGSDRRRGLGWCSVHLPQADAESLQLIRGHATQLAGGAKS